MRSRASTLVLVGCPLVAFLLIALFSSWVLVHHDYEAEYLALGNLAVRGQLNLYQDEMTGQWVPLPFYFFCASQLPFGPSLVAGRLLSIAVGLVAAVLLLTLAMRWGGPPAAAVAGGLFATHGLVVGYYATVDFSPLAAVLHLLGVYVLFCTGWPRRDLTAMAVFSVLFLVKPHYWPTIPFVWLCLLWRAGSLRQRFAITAVALAVPTAFFAWDPRHLKILAYVPVLRDWVAPLGYRSWHTLIEDRAEVWVSEYVDVLWQTTPGAQAVELVKAFAFFLKRYAVWILLLAGLGGLALLQAVRRRAPADVWGPDGLRFVFWLFWYLVGFQFVIVGPYIKQGFAYVGGIAPLLALVIGCLFATVWGRLGLPGPLRLAVAAAVIAGIAVSPWIHRAHNLPRTVSLEDGAIPFLRGVAARLATAIPAGETRIFFLGDPLPMYLAGRQPYLRQFHQHNMVFTSSRDRSVYVRSGMWGLPEIEDWLGSDARYAIIQRKVFRFYGSRKPYLEPVERMNALLAERFTLVHTVPLRADDAFLVYRRKDGPVATPPARECQCPATSS